MRAVLFLLLFGASAGAQQVTFLEPVGEAQARRTEDDPLPLYRVVSGDNARPWLENDAARRALWLYRLAFTLAQAKGNPGKQPANYFVALVAGGNHASTGLQVQSATGAIAYANTAYILLAPDQDAFTTTFLHETGHVAMAMLAGGRQLQPADIVSIPHSTAALTDRATAFSEGWAIHLETLNAQTATEAEVRSRYQHQAVRFGGGLYPQDEYFRNASDLASYAQNLARFVDVRENHFAFAQAYQGADYLRVQLEKARDFSELRTPNQLLQSEGFHASFFYLFTMRGKQPGEEVIRARHTQMLQAMQAMFARVKVEAGVPWLVEFLIEYMRLFPKEQTEVVTAFNDLTHGVFVDAAAATLWKQHYLAALRLDLKNLNRDGIGAARKRWHDAVIKDPSVLRARLGPQVGCQVAAVQVKVEMFGQPEPLLFDVNSVPAAILQLVPGLSGAGREAWIEEREKRPFVSLDDLRTRATAGKQYCGQPTGQ